MADSDQEVCSDGARIQGYRSTSSNSNSQQSCSDEPVLEHPLTQNTLTHNLPSCSSTGSRSPKVKNILEKDTSKSAFNALARKNKSEKRKLTSRIDRSQMHGKLARIDNTGYVIINVPQDLEQVVVCMKKKSASKYCSLKKFKKAKAANLVEIIPLNTAKELRAINKKSAPKILKSTLRKYTN